MTVPSTSVQASLEHCAAAASSQCQAVTWIEPLDDDAATLCYAAHNVLYVCQSRDALYPRNSTTSCWKVVETLRSQQRDAVVTALKCIRVTTTRVTKSNILLCGFSNGNIVVWMQAEASADNTSRWYQYKTKCANDALSNSITSIDGYVINTQKSGDDNAAATLCIVTASSVGSNVYTTPLTLFTNGSDESLEVISVDAVCHSLVSRSAARVVNCYPVKLNHKDDECDEVWIVIGTASPRNNQIHIYQHKVFNNNPIYAGALVGHLDWITCVAWLKMPTKNERILATGSHDARIRLWKFSTSIVRDKVAETGINVDPVSMITDNNDDDVIAEHTVDEDDAQEGESRLTLSHSNDSINETSTNLVTSVTLEALLYGHEDHVTSVHWHPNPPMPHNAMLISASMDRSILLWTASADSEHAESHSIWTPLTRVGSAGGILGGSVGSTLLGYMHASLEPTRANVLVGLAYGGSIHVWESIDSGNNGNESRDELQLPRWTAAAGISGHFGPVSDLCWEASAGKYLLTVSQDQTCRLWAPIKTTSGQPLWTELARPQVHGYGISAVASMSTKDHEHYMISGSDEKELRVFDAPQSTVRILQSATGQPTRDSVERVDRAYIPSLGLSNKANPGEGAEEENTGDDNDDITTVARLPTERDLGAISLWPEVGKLFGHNTELYRLCCNLAAMTKSVVDSESIPVIVASSCKARDPESAVIRLWNVKAGTCIDQLAGHKSTVATMSFSPDGQYLVSSGKDRRLCLWKRQDSGKFELAWAKDSAHKRIIWATHFCPFDATLVASGSRDGCVRIWKVVQNEGSTSLIEVCSFAPNYKVDGKPDSVTALSFAPLPLQNSSALLALGLESGRMELWSISSNNDKVSSNLLMSFDNGLCHGSTITKLAWRPLQENDSWQDGLLLASCSADHACRITLIKA